MYFPLQSIGIDMAYTSDGASRTAGIFVGGDANTISAVLGMCFGYIMAQIEKKRMRWNYYIALVFIILGIIQTGSRGGLLGIVGIFGLFFFRNKSSLRSIGLFSVIFLIVSSIIYFYGDNLIARFGSNNEYSANLDYDPNKYGGANIRFYKWGMYLDELKNNPDFLVIGNTRPKSNWIRFNVHNVFLVMLYYGGVIFFILYSIAILKIFRIKKSNQITIRKTKTD